MISNMLNTGVLLHAWILNDSLGFVVLILVHLSNNSERRKKKEKNAIIFVRMLKTMYKETIITYLVWTEWNPTTQIPIGCSCSTRGPSLHFGQSNCPISPRAGDNCKPIYTIGILQPIIFLWSDHIRKLILFV